MAPLDLQKLIIKKMAAKGSSIDFMFLEPPLYLAAGSATVFHCGASGVVSSCGLPIVVSLWCPHLVSQCDLSLWSPQCGLPMWSPLWHSPCGLPMYCTQCDLYCGVPSVVSPVESPVWSSHVVSPVWCPMWSLKVLTLISCLVICDDSCHQLWRFMSWFVVVPLRIDGDIDQNVQF